MQQRRILARRAQRLGRRDPLTLGVEDRDIGRRANLQRARSRRQQIPQAWRRARPSASR